MSIFLGPKPDRQHMQALNRCKLENPELLDLIRQRLEDTKRSLIMADEQVRMHRLQGRAEVLMDFLEAVEKSPEILERAK